jgi:hypothetical protein
LRQRSPSPSPRCHLYTREEGARGGGGLLRSAQRGHHFHCAADAALHHDSRILVPLPSSRLGAL